MIKSIRRNYLPFVLLKADVLLRGYSGWNTRMALEVLDKVFPKVLLRNKSVCMHFVAGCIKFFSFMSKFLATDSYMNRTNLYSLRWLYYILVVMMQRTLTQLASVLMCLFLNMLKTWKKWYLISRLVNTLFCVVIVREFHLMLAAVTSGLIWLRRSTLVSYLV